MRDICDLALTHRLEKADRDQFAANALVSVTGELRDCRGEVYDWLFEDVTPAERDELREVLGV